MNDEVKYQMVYFQIKISAKFLLFLFFSVAIKWILNKATSRKKEVIKYNLTPTIGLEIIYFILHNFATGNFLFHVLWVEH